MIHVLATIKLHPGRRNDFLAEFRKIIADVRNEAGCIEYGPAIDLPTDLPAQDGVRPNVVVVIEKWESLDALKAHLVAPHMVAYRPKVKEFVVATELQVLESAE